MPLLLYYPPSLYLPYYDRETHMFMNDGGLWYIGTPSPKVARLLDERGALYRSTVTVVGIVLLAIAAVVCLAWEPLVALILFLACLAAAVWAHITSRRSDMQKDYLLKHDSNIVSVGAISLYVLTMGWRGIEQAILTADEKMAIDDYFRRCQQVDHMVASAFISIKMREAIEARMAAAARRLPLCYHRNAEPVEFFDRNWRRELEWRRSERERDAALRTTIFGLN